MINCLFCFACLIGFDCVSVDLIFIGNYVRYDCFAVWCFGGRIVCGYLQTWWLLGFACVFLLCLDCYTGFYCLAVGMIYCDSCLDVCLDGCGCLLYLSWGYGRLCLLFCLWLCFWLYVLWCVIFFVICVTLVSWVYWWFDIWVCLCGFGLIVVVYCFGMICRYLL